MLRRRGRWKKLLAAAVGAALGALLKAVFDTELVSTFLDRFQMLAEMVPGARRWLDARPELLGWVAGPIVLATFFLGLASLPRGRRWIDRWIPDPPPFVASSLSQARSRGMVTSLEGESLPFVGRRSELGLLGETLAAGGTPFEWRMLTGPSGIGKTRLGLEWLERARAQGWDVGVVDRRDAALIAGWRPRRPTAVIIDEARREWSQALDEALVDLRRAASPRRKVRVLLIDQIPVALDIASGLERSALRSAEGPPLRLGPLADEHILELRALSNSTRLPDDVIVRESAGRPRAALILANAVGAATAREAVVEWVERVVPGICDDDRELPPGLCGPLFMAALAGPLDNQAARDVFGDVDAGALLRFYSDQSREELDHVLPAIWPDDVAQELLVRLLPRLDLRRREGAVDRLIADSPARVEARLGALWQDRPDFRSGTDPDSAERSLLWLQERFDAACPHRVAALRAQAERALALFSGDVDLPELDSGLAEVRALAAARPFDADVAILELSAEAAAGFAYAAVRDARRAEFVAECLLDRIRKPLLASIPEAWPLAAKGIASAVVSFGHVEDVDAMRLWARRFAGVVDDPRAPRNEQMRVVDADCSGVAMFRSAVLKDFPEVERWGERIERVAKHAFEQGELDALRSAATAVVNAILVYGDSNQFARLEEWCAWLNRIGEDGRYSSDPRLRLMEARGIVNAMVCYGRIGDVAAHERWGKKLVAIADDPRFNGDREIRRIEARGAGNAVGYYGGTTSESARGFGGQRSAVRRWGRRMLAVLDDPRFAGDTRVAGQVLMGMMNATAYEGPGDGELLEWWGDRILRVISDEALMSDKQIRRRVVDSLRNLMLHYGEAKAFDDMERWGAHVTDLAAREDYRADEDLAAGAATAACAALAMYHTVKMLEWGSARKWRSRLAGAALRFPGRLDIQEGAAGFGVSFMDQQRAGFPFGRPAPRSRRS
ncbi:MAG TPA: ATP-binding protein [Allosphingosinicella sp.]